MKHRRASWTMVLACTAALTACRVQAVDERPPDPAPTSREEQPPSTAGPTLESDDSIAADHPFVMAWLGSEAGELFTTRARPEGARLMTFGGSEAKLLIIPLSSSGSATEEIVAFFRDPAEGFETFVRSTDLTGEEPGKRSGHVGLVDVHGKQVLGVRVDGGEIQQLTSDLMDVNAPVAAPRAVSGAGADECFWSCMGGVDLWSAAIELACGECIAVSIFDPGLPNPLACKTCAALAGTKGMMCLSKCGLPGGVSGGGLGGGGCMGGGFSLFPGLCH